MNAHRGIIGQEATGQMDRQSQAQGETDMQTIIGKTQGRAAEGGHRRTRTPNKWRAAVFGLILSSGLTLGMAGTAQAALSVSITAPANNTVALAPASFTLTAIAGNPQGAPIQSVAFYANDGTTNTLLGTIAAPTGPGSITLPAQAAAKAPIGTAANTTYTWNWSSVPMGVYSVTAVVTDKSGGTATSTPVIVVADVPPTVGITRPADHSSAEPGDIPLAANATSPLGTVAKVAFYAATITNGTSGTPVLIGTATKGTGGTYTAIWLNAPLGKYTLTAIATDNWGITGPAGPITFTVTEPRPYYIHTDHLGTPRMITDTNGNVVWRWDNSDPFGNNMPNENPSGLGIFEYNQRLPGQYFDKETGLHYNVNRDYDPSIGRYIQSDPIGLLGGINTYTYVGGNPLSYTDPKGKNLLVVAGAVVVGGAVITGAVTYANNGGNLNGAVSSGVDAGIGIGIAGLVALATPETLVGALAGAVWDIGTDLYDSAKSVVEIISPANGETMTPLNPPISSSPSGTGAACP